MIHNFHSHKKREATLKGSLDRVLFVTTREFPNILVPRLPQNISDGNIECVGKSKQLYSLRDQLLGAIIYLNLIILILICFDYVCYKPSNIMVTSLREQLQEYHYTLNTGGKTLLQ